MERIVIPRERIFPIAAVPPSPRWGGVPWSGVGERARRRVERVTPLRSRTRPVLLSPPSEVRTHPQSAPTALALCLPPEPEPNIPTSEAARTLFNSTQAAQLQNRSRKIQQKYLEHGGELSETDGRPT